MDRENYLSPIEFVQNAKMSIANVYRMIYEDKIPFKKIGGKWLITVEDADKFMADREAQKAE